MQHPLVELSTCADPGALQHPAARKAVLSILQRLRRQSVSKRWPLPHQIAALAYCELAKDRALIADEQGLGKTGVAVLRILLSGAKTAVVVCPASVLGTWKEELALWLPQVPVHVVQGTRGHLPPRGWRGVVVTTWDLLRLQPVGLGNMAPDIIVADEAHYVLNDEALRSLALASVAKASPRLLLLTGTPIKNLATDLHALLVMLDEAAWADPEPFEALGADALGSAQIPTMLAHRIKQYMVRRLKTEATKLPAKRYTTLPVDMTEVEAAEYKKIEEKFAAWLRKEMRRKRLPPGEDPEEALRRALKSQYLVQVGYLRRFVGGVKIRHAVDWVKAARKIGEPVVVFAEHKHVVDGIVAGLRDAAIAHAVISGSLTRAKREKAKQDFTEGRVHVLVATQAAKEGITLTRARHLLFVERWWTSAAEDQGSDRIHRISQTRDVDIWTLQVRNTIDVRMAKIVRRKRRLIQKVVRGDGPIPGVSASGGVAEPP